MLVMKSVSESIHLLLRKGFHWLHKRRTMSFHAALHAETMQGGSGRWKLLCGLSKVLGNAVACMEEEQ